MTTIKRWDILVSTMQMSRMQEYRDGDYVLVQDLLSGHVLEHEGKRYRLVPEEPTKTMCHAGYMAITQRIEYNDADMPDVYRAMIGAGK